MPVTVGDLKKILADLDEDIVVGVEGWYGELYPFQFVPTVKKVPLNGTCGYPQIISLVFDHIDIGEEPD